MNRSFYYHLTAVFVLLLSLIFSFHLILFLLTIVVSSLFGITLFLEINWRNVAKDYEIFNEKQNDSIRFIDYDDNHWRQHLNDRIKRKISLIKKLEFNQKFTKNSVIDNQLNEILELIIIHHVRSWFRFISNNQEFPSKLYLFLTHVIKSLIKRLQKLDLAELLINKFVDEIIKHRRIYRLTKSKLEYKIHTNEELVLMFFNIERKSEKTFSHEKVCLDQESFQQFLTRICDILQYSLFTNDSFKDETFKIITKHILIKMIFLPLFDTFSEPDFINRIIVSMLKSSNHPTTETFINILQSTDDVNELRAVLESVEQEIMFVRSKDQDDEDSKMKQQLNSLIYLKKIILSHLKKFDHSGAGSGGSTQPSTPATTPTKLPIEEKITVSFDTILRHNSALEYFIEYMNSIGAEPYINFYINVQTFKISIEQGLFEIYLSSVNDSITNEHYQNLQTIVHDTAMNIYETYLSVDAPDISRLKMVDQNLCQQLYENLVSEDSCMWMNENLFDEILLQVREIILNNQEFFPSFQKSKYYRKLLGEPDLLRDSLDDDTVIPVENNGNETMSDAKHPSGGGEDSKIGFFIEIIDTGILNLQGKPFIGYLINVEQKSGKNWTLLRRYSEFNSFHQTMLEKCEKFHLNLKNILFLPPKTVLSNKMNANFIQYRKQMLDLYLKKLNYIYEKFIFLREDIEKFLQPGSYDSMNISKNLMLNPIKTIGHVFRNQSENILDSFQRLSRTFSLQADLNKTTGIVQQDSCGGGNGNKRTFQTNSLGSKHTTMMSDDLKRNMYSNNSNMGSSNDLSSSDYNGSDNGDFNTGGENEYEENIPLLILLDEVFELKNQNFWLRRTIIELFKQYVEVAYSGTINKKMNDYINEWTTSTSVGNYLNSFKNMFWPDGLPATSVQQKRGHCLRRKVAAKALILTFFSDLRRVFGNETLQTGLMSFFESFQNKTLNLRLIFVLFELILKELFPNHRLDEIFARLYGTFDDKCLLDEITKDWPPYLSKFIAKS